MKLSSSLHLQFGMWHSLEFALERRGMPDLSELYIVEGVSAFTRALGLGERGFEDMISSCVLVLEGPKLFCAIYALSAFFRENLSCLLIFEDLWCAQGSLY